MPDIPAHIAETDWDYVEKEYLNPRGRTPDECTMDRKWIVGVLLWLDKQVQSDLKLNRLPRATVLMRLAQATARMLHGKSDKPPEWRGVLEWYFLGRTIRLYGWPPPDPLRKELEDALRGNHPADYLGHRHNIVLGGRLKAYGFDCEFIPTCKTPSPDLKILLGNDTVYVEATASISERNTVGEICKWLIAKLDEKEEQLSHSPSVLAVDLSLCRDRDELPKHFLSTRPIGETLNGARALRTDRDWSVWFNESNCQGIVYHLVRTLVSSFWKGRKSLRGIIWSTQKFSGDTLSETYLQEHDIEAKDIVMLDGTPARIGEEVDVAVEGYRAVLDRSLLGLVGPHFHDCYIVDLEKGVFPTSWSRVAGDAPKA